MWSIVLSIGNVVLKICFMIISIYGSMLMFRLLKRFSYDKTKNFKKNLNKFSWYCGISLLTDIVLTVLTALTIVPGTYGTGIELIAAVLCLLIYLPICIICVSPLKKKFLSCNEHWTAREKYLIKNSANTIFYGIPFKCILFSVIFISLEKYYVDLLEKFLL